jgi:hypothetical protein
MHAISTNLAVGNAQRSQSRCGCCNLPQLHIGKNPQRQMMKCSTPGNML